VNVLPASETKGKIIYIYIYSKTWLNLNSRDQKKSDQSVFWHPRVDIYQKLFQVLLFTSNHVNNHVKLNQNILTTKCFVLDN
jgi:hypothetical protein